MMTPELTRLLTSQIQAQSQSQAQSQQTPPKATVLLVGIESHICVTQTTLDLLAQGHRVYVLADGVSSCNAGERPVALARLARAGAVVTSSEGVLFELLTDARAPEFREISALVRQMKEDTSGAVETFCRL